MKNLEIAHIFREIAKILEIKGENVFRIRAYERAAQNIEGLTLDIETLAKENKLKEIPGIGKDLALRIEEFLDKGKIKMLEDLKKSIPDGLLDLLNIPSVGPKTVKLLYEKLKIKNISGLEEAIDKNKLKGIFGIKEKTIANISQGIAILKKGRERMLLAQAEQVAEGILKPLSRLKETQKISAAGSLRRKKETVRDIDILVASSKPKKIMEALISLPLAETISLKGETKTSLLTKEGIQIDCRVVENKSFGAALLYFTGSKDFNIKLRQIAIRKGLKINEYGIFKNKRYLAGITEEEIFKLLGMSYIEPELRENTGEIELAQKNILPKIIEEKDIKGDLHVHSSWSDGNSSIRDIAKTAKSLGYSYVAITDHSQSLRIANGLNTSMLKKKKAEIEKINSSLSGLRILFGTEADIDADGNIDYPDRILKEFDIVIAAIHTGFKQSHSQLTKRIIRACQNKFVHIIAHPTGRLFAVRDAYQIDFTEIFKVAKDTNTAMEINSFPNRLDLNDLNCRRAKDVGVKIAINTDSHEAQQLKVMRLGIAVARRGWLTAGDVLNTLPLKELLNSVRK